jgi:hypothetical protein
MPPSRQPRRMHAGSTVHRSGAGPAPHGGPGALSRSHRLRPDDRHGVGRPLATVTAAAHPGGSARRPFCRPAPA